MLCNLIGFIETSLIVNYFTNVKSLNLIFGKHLVPVRAAVFNIM